LGEEIMNPQDSDLVEICDAAGRVVGHIAPASKEQAPLHAQTATRMDRAEIARRKGSHKTGRTTREVFQRLQSLTQDSELIAHLQAKIDSLQE
jgi:hypothetical protein